MIYPEYRAQNWPHYANIIMLTTLSMHIYINWQLILKMNAYWFIWSLTINWTTRSKMFKLEKLIKFFLKNINLSIILCLDSAWEGSLFFLWNTHLFLSSSIGAHDCFLTRTQMILKQNNIYLCNVKKEPLTLRPTTYISWNVNFLAQLFFKLRIRGGGIKI